MKRNIIINGALGLLLAGSMASCASDYLDTEPLSNVTDAQVGATTENLAKAINGMGFFLNMFQVDQSTGGVYQDGYPCGSCGEGYFMSYFGDCYSSDTYQNHFAIFQSGQVVRMELVANNNWYSNSKAWGFYYATRSRPRPSHSVPTPIPVCSSSSPPAGRTATTASASASCCVCSRAPMTCPW